MWGGDQLSLNNELRTHKVDCDDASNQSAYPILCGVADQLTNKDLAQLGEASACEADCKNPVQMVTGNKFDKAIDYLDPTGGGLSFIRYYNSHRAQYFTASTNTAFRMAATPGLFFASPGWTHSFNYRVQSVVENGSYIRMIRPDGAIWTLGDFSDTTPNQVEGVFDTIRDGSTGELQGYIYDNLTNSIEFYDKDGYIFALKYYNGLEVYINNDKATGSILVSNNRGRSLRIDNGSSTSASTSKVTLPTGVVLSYYFSGADFIVTANANSGSTNLYTYKSYNGYPLNSKIVNGNTVSSWGYSNQTTNKLTIATSAAISSNGSQTSVITYPANFDTRNYSASATTDGPIYTVVDTDEIYRKTYSIYEPVGSNKRVRTGLSVECIAPGNGCVSYTENTVHNSYGHPTGVANSKEGFLTCTTYTGDKQQLPSRIIAHLPIGAGVSSCAEINGLSNESVVSGSGLSVLLP